MLQIMIFLLRKDNTGRHFSWANQKKCWTYISWTLGNSHKNVTKALVLTYCMKFWRHLNLANLEKSSQNSCRQIKVRTIWNSAAIILVSFTHYLKYEWGQHKDMTLQLQFRLFRSKLIFRTSCDFDLNEAIDVYDFIT